MAFVRGLLKSSGLLNTVQSLNKGIALSKNSFIRFASTYPIDDTIFGLNDDQRQASYNDTFK